MVAADFSAYGSPGAICQLCAQRHFSVTRAPGGLVGIQNMHTGLWGQETINFAHHGTFSPGDSTINRSIKVRLRVLYHHIGYTGQHNLYIATLVRTSVGSPGVGQSDDYLLDMATAVSQGGG